MTASPTYRVISNPIGPQSPGLHVLFAGESQTRPHHRVGPKVVDYFLLHHVLSGKGRFRTAEFEGELGPGDSFLIQPGQLNEYVSDEAEPWRYRWVAFAGSQAQALVAAAGLGPLTPVAHTGDDRSPRERCKAIFECFRMRDASASMAASGHLHLLLADLYAAGENGSFQQPARPDSHSDELVRLAIGYLSTQYAEPITIEAMAETLGYNRAYLSRLFKRQVGLSPVTFLTKLRIDHGKRLLRERPELTVEQIASSVGIQDALYFSKQFRRWHGQSPTEYRTAVGRAAKLEDNG